MLTLKELINRCLQKDQAAWGEFVLRFKPLAERSVRARFSRHNFPYTIEDVKDLTQSIFLDIWEYNKLEQVKQEDKVTAWVVIVAQNAAIDFIRSSKKFLRQDTAILGEEGEVANLVEDLACASESPFQELVKSELSKALGLLLESLEPREKVIFKLAYLHNLAHKEIAGLLSLPLNTVSTIIRRSRLRLKELLEKKGFKDF